MDDDDNDNGLKARSYQNQLLEIALNENSIIYLPTGSGKTFIALMAMKQLSKHLKGSLSTGGKRIVFMCNTVALANQQYDVIKKQLNLKTNVYTSEKNTDDWDRSKWNKELDENQVLVATCQIVLDIICANYISINNFALMIFDECHHAIGDHPMHRIMDLFRNADQQNLPRVIALTGTLLNSSKISRMYKDLADLEAVFRGKIITVENMDEYKNVLIYSTKPLECVIRYDDNNDFDDEEILLYDTIKNLISDCCEKIKNFRIDEVEFVYSKSLFSTRAPNPINRTINLLNDFLFQTRELGMFAASKSCLAVIVELEIKKRATETENHSNMLKLVITYMERINHLISNKIYKNANESNYDRIMNNSTKKLTTFLLYLKNEFAHKAMNEVQCLLFVHRRYTAKILYHIINIFTKEIPSLKLVPNFVVGKDGMCDTIEALLENHRTNNALKNLRENKCNLIIASAVLEEGIDLPACNYVIIFDEINTFRSYCQTKGRARMNSSYYVIMIPKSKEKKILDNIKNFKTMDGLLKEYLIGKTIDRKMPSVNDIEKQFTIKIKSFTSNIGAILKPESAIPLLNRYCQFLYGKDCNTSTLSYSKEDLSDGNFCVKLFLPLLSTIKQEICGDPMPNVKWAKRSVAFKACILLYKNGELNGNFLPTSHQNILDKLKPVYFEHLNSSISDKPQNDIKNNRQHHKNEYPKQLFSAVPKLNTQCFLYEILILTKFDKESDISFILELLNNNKNYAILTSKELPKLAEITLFISQQKISVKISTKPTSLIIDNKSDFDKLKNFHLTIFRDIIKSTWSNYIAYDCQNKENSFLIVPTIDSNRINWELVENFQKMPEKIELTEIQRKNLKIESKNYLNNLIIPWYNADKNQYFIVKSILNDLNPTSKYPQKKFLDYIDYMNKTHNINIAHNNQLLIEAQGIAFTNDTNFLTLKDSKIKSKLLTVIPELCNNLQFPGEYWLKAKLLPSILHRIHCLLLAENLRNELNTYLNLENINYEPVPINYNDIIELNNVNAIEKPILFSQENENNEKLKSLNLNLFAELANFNYKLENIQKKDIDNYHFMKTQIYKLGNDFEMNQFKPIKLINEKKRNSLIKMKNIEMLNIRDPINGLEQYEILQALTTTGAQDIFDNERLELLGDAFLKFSVSLFTLCKNPKWNEGLLTSVKNKFVCNKNLLNLSIKLKLPGIIKNHKFQANRWLPPLISPPFNLKNLLEENNVSETIFSELVLDEEEIENGSCKVETLQKINTFFSTNQIKTETEFSFLMNTTWIPDKVCADVVEALLGLCVKNYGIAKTFSILDYFGICPCKTNLLKEIYPNQRNDSNVTIEQIDEFLLNYTILENNISYKFIDRGLLLAALTHPSYILNRITSCYQQLEFIGDAIIDFLITMYIFEQCEDKTSGDLTDIRTALVNNVTFACIAVRYKLHLFLLTQCPSLNQSIAKFVEFQEKYNYEITDINLISNKENDLITSDYVDTPKALGDIFEAVIGAVFVDSSCNLEKTWEILYGLMEYELNEFLSNVPIQIVRKLTEYEGARPQFYDAISKNGVVEVKCSFYKGDEKHLVVGLGSNKKQAKNSAAKAALKVLIKS